MDMPENGIPKAPTGIPGFDDIAHGGLPRERSALVLGGPGTGKTLFALQTLVNGARHWNEPGIFVAFEENSRAIIANAASFGWDIPALEPDRLFFLDARPSPDLIQAGTFDLKGLLAALQAKAAEMQARRIVFDSIDVLLALLDNPTEERRELYRVHDWLLQSGLSGIVTARLDRLDESISRYGFMQFMADCVVVLHNRVADRVALREMRIFKYRGSAFEQNEFPFTIATRGIEVASFDTTSKAYPIYTDKVSSGVPALDDMLGGGYFRGSSVLITGSPGTAKTTLAGSFAQAASRRGEKVLYVGFDEGATEIVRNLQSVAIYLAPLLDRGLLHIEAMRSEARSAEEHLLKVKSLIDGFKPTCLVVDPISAMVKAGGQMVALTVAERLIHLAKLDGITLLATSLLESRESNSEASQIRVSTVADTWIHLSYVAKGGERNRAISIIKVRGARHSSQVRELVLSDQGVTLKPAYMAGGEVLMGTLRWEKETEQRLAQERARLDLERKRRELELAQIEATARVEALKREAEAGRVELEALIQQQEAQEKRRREADRERGARRGGSDQDDDGEPGSDRE